MLGTKYLSELVNFNHLFLDELNIVQAPTGSGKTFFALHTIPEICKDPLHQALYLIDTINGKEQILRNYNASPSTYNWIKDINEGYGCAWETRDEHVVIMTYALFGEILKSKPDFGKHFQFIICDELPSLIKFQNFSKKPNSHSIAKEGLEHITKDETTIVIALTATPKPLFKSFKTPCRLIPIDQEELRHYETKTTKHYYSIKHLISTMDVAETGLCFASRIMTMKDIEAAAAAHGLNPICVWSTNNVEHPMNENQLRVRKSILEDFSIPPEYNFLIINSSSETSIKIKSPVDYVIVHHSNEDTQIQVRGRVNKDLKTLYLPSSEINDLLIPDDFLGRRLFKEDKDKLCDVLEIRNKNGRPLKWTSLNKLLPDNHYNTEEGRYKNKRYTIITSQK